MSPLSINILLHYHARTTDYAAWVSSSERQHAESPAVYEVIKALVGDGLLKSRFGDVSWAIRESVNVDDEEPFFSITDKGLAMVKHLCAVQVPVCQWVQPATLSSGQR